MLRGLDKVDVCCQSGYLMDSKRTLRGGAFENINILERTMFVDTFWNSCVLDWLLADLFII